MVQDLDPKLVKSVASIVLSRKTLAHATAGCVGSMLAMTLTYPLDRVRVMKQLSNKSKFVIKSGGESESKCLETDSDNSYYNKNVFSLLRDVVVKDGVENLYRGLMSLVITLGISNFVYFYWYTALKAIWQRKFSPHLGTLGNLLLASIAGTINVLITNPLWVAYTRFITTKGSALNIETSKNKINPGGNSGGLFSSLLEIARNEGASALWSGMGPSLLLVSNPSVQFVSYEKLKEVLLSLKKEGVSHSQTQIFDDGAEHAEVLIDADEEPLGPELSGPEYFLLGAAAKLVATLVTYPIQVAQTRLRADRKIQIKQEYVEYDNKKKKKKKILHRQTSAGQYTGTLDCLLDIYRKDGVKGLYRGVDAKIIQTCLNAAFMFTAYEKIYASIFRLMLASRRKPRRRG